MERPGINADLVRKRYVQGDEKSWGDVAMRVAKHAGEHANRTAEFYDAIHNGVFFPSRMTYMGTSHPFASSCFVFPVEDDLAGIMQTLSHACQVQKFGGGCIGGESMVLTDHGPIPMKELVERSDPNIRVLSYNPATHATEYRQVGDWHTTPLPGHRVFEIELGVRGNSAKMRASDRHPFFVFDGEKIVEVRADELKPGMAVIGASSFSDEYSPYHWLLGYIVGDGAVDHNRLQQYARVRVVDNNERAVARAAKVAGVQHRLSGDGRYQSPVWELSIHGDMAEQIRNEFDFDPTSDTKHIPASVWQADAAGRFSFLVGYLDADGWYSTAKERFEAYTVSERLAKELVALAGSIGIQTTLRRRTYAEPNPSDGWVITFLRSRHLTGAVCGISAKYGNLTAGWSNGSVPLSNGWREKLRDAGVDTYNKAAWRRPVRVGGSEMSLVSWLQHGKATRETAAAILATCGKDQITHAVRSSHIVSNIRCTGTDETLYDLTVPGTQTYIASDPTTGAYVVVHNTGYNFSHLRPKGDLIKSSGGDASGPVSFMGLFHHAMEVVHRAGKKHAAQMGILNCDHPNIYDFITCKDVEGAFWTFNISVAVTDAFMQAVEADADWDLQWGGKVYKTVKARELWGYIVQHAWHNGDPGIIFIDTVNRHNCYPEPIEACNPCGEQMLPSNVSCNLGSIDLSRLVRDGEVNWKGLENATRTGVRFLDASVEIAYWPVREIQEKTHKYRNIGLGVMGWADMLILLGIPYDSDEAVMLGEQVMKFINDTGDDESRQLRETALAHADATRESRGVAAQIAIENHDHWAVADLNLEEASIEFMRARDRKNTTVTSIAPTGSISMLAGCSSGIEPIFGIVTAKHSYSGTFYQTHWMFEKIARERGFYSDGLMAEIAATGSVQHVEGVPDEVKALFKTGNEIGWEWHVRHQAAFQQHVHNSTSKTVNMPFTATPEDVDAAYRMAYETGCKSITVYRDGSRSVQVLDNKITQRETCPHCNAILFMSDGERVCVTCGYKPEPKAADESGPAAELSPLPHTNGDAPPRKLKRASVLRGSTYRKDTPLGTAYVTVNANGEGPVEPLEVFVNVGKAGSEVTAVSEAIGRLASLHLRTPSLIPQIERLAHIADELIGIGGGQPLGFGFNRVRSLPDGIAQVLRQHISALGYDELIGVMPPTPTTSVESAATKPRITVTTGDLCPECGQGTLVYEEGCRKCHNTDCGYSAC